MMYSRCKIDGANLFQWCDSGAKTFHIDLAFYLDGKTLPTKYDQLPHLLEHVYGHHLLTLQDKGGIVNASTGQDRIDFYCSLPAEYLDEVVELFVKTLLGRKEVDDSDIKREVRAISAEMSAKMRRPAKRLRDVMTSTLLDSSINSIGALDSLPNLDKSKLIQLRDELLTVDKLVIYAAGNVSGVEEVVRRHLSTLCVEPGVSGDEPLMKPLSITDWESVPPVIDQSGDDEQVQFAWLCFLQNRISQFDFAVYEIIKRFLRSADKNSFFNCLRNNRIAYDLFAGPTGTFIPGHPLYQLTGTVKRDNVTAAIDLLNEKLADLANHPQFIEQKLPEYREALRNNRLLSYQTPQQIVQRAMSLYVRDGRPDEDIDRINDITVDDVVRCIDNIVNSKCTKTFIVSA